MAGGFDISGMFDSILGMFQDPSMDPKLKEDLAMRLDGMGVPPPQGMGGMGGAMSLPGGGLGGLIGMLGGSPGNPNGTSGISGSESDNADWMGGVGKAAPAAPTGGPGEPARPEGTSDGPPNAADGSADAGGKNTAGKPSGLAQGLGAAGQVLAKPPAPQEIPKGVVGGVKAPEHPQANPAFLNMIAALLNHPPGNAATAPGASLGSLIR